MCGVQGDEQLPRNSQTRLMCPVWAAFFSLPALWIAGLRVGMYWHQAAAFFAEGDTMNKTRRRLYPQGWLFTASLCGLARTLGGAVERKGRLHCPHHQVFCLCFIWKSFQPLLPALCVSSSYSQKAHTAPYPPALGFWLFFFFHKVRIRDLRVRSQSKSLQRNVPWLWPSQSWLAHL